MGRNVRDNTILNEEATDGSGGVKGTKLPMRDNGRADAVLAYSSLATYNIAGRIADFHDLDPGGHEALGYDLWAVLEALPDSPWAEGARDASEPSDRAE